MNVYVGWSGGGSLKMTETLTRWLQSFFQDKLSFWNSAEVSTGGLWMDELKRKLSEANFGLLCITRGSVQSSPWLLFEAGLLSARDIPVRTVLSFGVSPSELAEPLKQFPSFSSDRDGIGRLVYELNSFSPQAMPLDTLNSLFDTMYPALQRDFERLMAIQHLREEQQRKDPGGQENSLASVNKKLDAVLSVLASMSETPAKKTVADFQAHRRSTARDL